MSFLFEDGFLVILWLYELVKILMLLFICNQASDVAFIFIFIFYYDGSLSYR